MCVLYRVIEFSACVCEGSVKVCASRPDCFIATLDLLQARGPFYAVKGKMELFCLYQPSGCVCARVCAVFILLPFENRHIGCVTNII